MLEVSHQLKMSLLQLVAGIWGRGPSVAPGVNAAHTSTFLIHPHTQACAQNPLLSQKSFCLALSASQRFKYIYIF